MSIKSIVESGFESTLRGLLEQEIAKSGSRLSPGGYQRAIDRAIDLLRVRSRYDKQLIKNNIGPSVLERFRISRRENANRPVRPSSIPYRPGETARRGEAPIYEYTIRGRIQGADGTGRQDWIVVIQSRTALSRDEAYERARQASVAGRVTQDYQGRVPGIDAATVISWSIIDTVRRSASAAAGEA